MNIVYLHAHDCGRFVQPYGYPIESPNLMQFAKEGVLFRKAFAVSPTCGPSRSALLTGTYPHQHGMFGLPGSDGWLINDYQKHLVNVLNGWGYQTVLSGVQHEANHSDFTSIAYERVLEREEPLREQDGEFYQESIDKVERFLATRDDERPFFLSVGIDEPHRDNIPRPELGLHGSCDRYSKTRYYDPSKLDWRYTAPPPWLPDLPEIRRDMESFREGVRIMDEYMGRVLYALRHGGYEDNTMVIVTSDHGIEFPGGKMTLSDQGLQVMCIVKGPKDSPFSGGKVIEPMISQLDLMPTLCEMLDRRPMDYLEGKSLVPLVSGEESYVHDYLFCEQTYHGVPEPLRCVRTERYKYVRRHFGTGPRLRQAGTLSTPVMEDAGWFDRACGSEELYDLYLDPMEACNRIDDPVFSEVRKELSSVLENWMRETNDPFLEGKIPPLPEKE